MSRSLKWQAPLPFSASKTAPSYSLYSCDAMPSSTVWTVCCIPLLSDMILTRSLAQGSADPPAAPAYTD